MYPERSHGGRAGARVDLSAPVNPLGPPGFARELLRECSRLSVASRYPDPGLDSLREALARLSGLLKHWIVPLNGSAEALALAPLVYRPDCVVVVEPSFGDHGLQSRAWPSRLVRVVAFAGGRQRLPPAWDPPRGTVLSVMAWPGNPTGQPLSEGDVKLLAGASDLLVVDEAFQPLSPLPHVEVSAAQQLTLWTPTKALALPGLRLGAAASREWEVVEPLELARQPWPVDAVTHCFYSRLAESYLEEALRHVERGVEASAEARVQALRALAAHGVEAHPSVAPYILVRHPGASHPCVHDKALQAGVAVRRADTFHGLTREYTRISLPADPRPLIEGIEALARAVARCRGVRGPGWG